MLLRRLASRNARFAFTALILLAVGFVYRQSFVSKGNTLIATSTLEKVNLASQRLLVNTIRTTPFYRRIGKPCHGNKKRQRFRSLLKYWDGFAKRHGIQYVISFGSLLGQYRDKDVIPWDNDVDVIVNITSFQLLRKFSHRRNFKYGQDKKFRLIVHPEFETKDEDDRGRWNCQGKKVQEQIDACSFVMPIARLLQGFPFVDIFYFVGVDNLVRISGEEISQNRTDLYPFVRCTFMNIRTWCPNNSKKVLQNFYGNIEPEYVCKNGQWI